MNTTNLSSHWARITGVLLFSASSAGATMLVVLSHYVPVIMAKLISIAAGLVIDFAMPVVGAYCAKKGAPDQSDEDLRKSEQKQYISVSSRAFYLETGEDVT